MSNINNKLKVESWPIDKLIPYARNPRINDDAVPKLAGLIKEFGFKVPIVITSDGGIIDGHERYKAALLLGLNDVPVTIADEWTPAQVKAFRIAANKSSEWAEWNNELLKLELDDLQDMNFDTESLNIGFDDFNLDLSDNANDINFEPGSIDDQGKLDERKQIDFIKCPHCGNVIDVKKAKADAKATD